jgi:hypothetical protein
LALPDLFGPSLMKALGFLKAIFIHAFQVESKSVVASKWKPLNFSLGQLFGLILFLIPDKGTW